ncbi:MAG: flagellar basal body rod protein FlgB [Pseudomonadota bacterium]
MNANNHSLFNKTIQIVGQSLGLRLARHSMITSNLANIDTPGYKVRDLKFETAMQRALGPKKGELQMMETKSDHLPATDLKRTFRAAERDVVQSEYGRDENGMDILDIDQEMTKLSKNHLLYNTTVQILSKEFENLKYAISEGGR